MGRVPELLINSEKASTSHVFNEYIERFLRFRFSMIQTHDPKMKQIKKRRYMKKFAEKNQ